MSFYLEGKRYRYFNANVLGKEIYPNKVVKSSKQEEASKLLLEFTTALKAGWGPECRRLSTIVERLSRLEIPRHYTDKYKKATNNTVNHFVDYIKENNSPSVVTPRLIRSYLSTYEHSPSSYNHERKRLHSIFSRVLEEGERNPVSTIKKKKERQVLHRPFDNVAAILDEIRVCNSNLHLCCLLTYGALLRPHQEVRKLTWGDFDASLNYIELSGKHTKNGRNRIVPVPPYVREHLERGEPNKNIFSGSVEPFSESYFKVLWRRYKASSQMVGKNQTLYSFRHTGAIELYKRTGSLVKLQSAMGHSDLNVTLGYLRNLPVSNLDVSDMPKV